MCVEVWSTGRGVPMFPFMHNTSCQHLAMHFVCTSRYKGDLRAVHTIDRQHLSDQIGMGDSEQQRQKQSRDSTHTLYVDRDNYTRLPTIYYNLFPGSFQYC